MRVVLDTNILISAVIKPSGAVAPILAHLRDGDYTILYSQVLLDELVDVLNRPRIRNKYQLSSEDVQTVVALILLRGEPVVPDEPITACRDPKDNKFLETAVAGQADLIVSGDDDLLILHPFANIPIITPADFLRQLP